LIAAGSILSDALPGARISAAIPVTDMTLLATMGDEGWLTAGAPAANRSNSWPIALGFWPDLKLTAADIQYDGAVTITARNTGVTTATGAALAVWQDSLSGTPVYSGALGSLGPGSSGVVTFSLAASSTGRLNLWAKVDPDNRLRGSSESNNLAFQEFTVWRKVYLPLVLKGN